MAASPRTAQIPAWRSGGSPAGSGRAGGAQDELPERGRSPRRAGARVLSWLMQGFERMVPQPEMPKKLEVSTARLGETGGLLGGDDSGAGSPSSCMPQLGGKPQGKFSRAKERPQAGRTPVGHSVRDPLVPAVLGSGFDGCQWKGAEAAVEGVWVPVGWGLCPPRLLWGHRRCFAMSVCLSVPLQPELKEQKSEATAGGERPPSPGGPFRGDILPSRSRVRGCPPSPGCQWCREGWARRSWHHGTAPTPHLSPNHPCPRPKLGPQARSCQGGPPSRSLCGRGSFLACYPFSINS